ncbi:MAG: hypothetical protein GY953_49065 [bacterium]|nr:hypothetical protein [bacterium]
MAERCRLAGVQPPDLPLEGLQVAAKSLHLRGPLRPLAGRLAAVLEPLPEELVESFEMCGELLAGTAGGFIDRRLGRDGPGQQAQQQSGGRCMAWEVLTHRFPAL